MPSFSTILLYAGLTAVTLLVLIATTRAIGQAPLFQLNSNSTVNDGWKPITDSQLQFTLNLPEAWQSIELADETTSLHSSSAVQALTDTFNALVADTELILLGAEDTAVFADGSPVFVLVAQSKQLQRLSPDETISYAQEQLADSITIIEAYTSEEDGDEIKGILLFDMEQGDKRWTCLEQFVPDNAGAYLVATCTSSNQFPTNLADFNLILRSFQPLRS